MVTIYIQKLNGKKGLLVFPKFSFRKMSFSLIQHHRRQISQIGLPVLN